MAHLAQLAQGFSMDAPEALSREVECHDRWPLWPSPALGDLVGPPDRRRRQLDLDWLHRLEVTAAAASWFTRQIGGPEGGPSALSLLVERAAMLGHRGWGATSAGGSARLVRVADGWLALNLPRDSDREALPAWLEVTPAVLDISDPWATLESLLVDRPLASLRERAVLLGLAVGCVADTPAGAAPQAAEPAVDAGNPWSGRDVDRPLVIDLSSLWAGPLCGWYLARSGAEVVKVESTRRPDGARAGTPAFHRRLNGNKTILDLDLGDEGGRAQLRELVARADVVIEGSRPRALAAMGIDAAEVVDRGAIWCSITGHGRSGPASDRVGFGDDAAAEGGLLTWVDGQPWFIGDAAGDPIAGLTAAALVLARWWAGHGGMVDVGLSGAVRLHTLGGPVASAGYPRRAS